MVSHHPKPDLIQKFAQGDLQAPLASVVSAHIEFCPMCFEKVKSLEADLAEDFFSNSLSSPKSEKKQAWSQLASRLQMTPVKKSENSQASVLQIQGQSFNLPRSIKSLDSSNIKWMPFGQGGKITKLAEKSNENLYLIYLASGETVPTHSHQGVEYTYVISGSFKADGQEFTTGDFSRSDQSTVHAPQATSDDGCLILSSVEERLNFLQGTLKPLNGVLWWFLNFKFRKLNT